MSPSADSAREPTNQERIQEVIAACIDLRAKGEMVSDEHLIAAHPELMPDLEHALRDLRFVENAREAAQRSTCNGLRLRCPHCQNPIEIVDDSSFTDVTCPSCGSQFNLADETFRSCDASRQEMIHHFRLVERVGSGAFGSVWRAHDTQLDRFVAIKIPRKGRLNSEEMEQFMREARAAAQLKHPNIVSVLEVGRHDDRIYIASDFIQGIDLADWLADQQATHREAAELCATIADAVEHAHQHGVIHRDIKPSNIMLDASGDPHLMDFGLAKRDAGEITMTAEGKLLGTPAYMSPEQARGSAHDADARSDVYSLGVILFELLTGERPFRGNTRMLLHQVLLEDAPSPRTLNSSIPRDLETICLKCLEKNPGRRYHSAGELRDDLKRFLCGECVQARRIRSLEVAWRWCKRKPLTAAFGAMVVALAVIGPVIALGMMSLFRGQQEANRRLEEQLYVTRVAAAHQVFDHENNVQRAQEILDLCLPTNGGVDRRGFEWFYMNHLCNQAMSVPSFNSGRPVMSLSLSPSGDLLSVSSATKWQLAKDEDVSVWNWATGQCITKIPAKADKSCWVSENVLAFAGRADEVTLWDIVEQKSVGMLPLPDERQGVADASLRTFVASPDGKFVVGVPASDRKLPLIWKVADRSLVPLRGDVGEVMAVAMTSDMMACGVRGGSVSFWSLKDGTEARPRIQPSGRFIVTALAFSPSSEMLAVGGEDGMIDVYDLTSSELVAHLPGHTHRVTSLVYLDNERLASGSEDKTVRLWDVTEGALRIYTSHGGTVQSIAYHARQAKLITGGSDGQVRTQSIEQTPKAPVIEVAKLEYGRQGVDFSPTTDAIVVGNDGELRVFDRAGTDLKWPAMNSASVGFSPDGLLLAVTEIPNQQNGLPNHDEPITGIWDVKTRQRRCYIPGVLNCFSSDSRHVFVTVRNGDGRCVQQWSIATIQSPSRIRTFADYAHAVAIPGRPWLALKRQEDKTVQLLNLNDASLVTSLAFESTITSGCVFPRQHGAAIGTLDGIIHIVDSSYEREVGTLAGHGGPIWGLDVSPDGRTLASGSDDGTVRLWHLSSRSHLFTLTDHGSAVVQVRFSHDGAVLATGSIDGMVRLRRTDTRIGRIIRQPLGASPRFLQTSYEPDASARPPRAAPSGPMGSYSTSSRPWDLTTSSTCWRAGRFVETP